MFVISLRVSTIKLFAVALLTVVVLILVPLAGIPATAAASAAGNVTFSGMRTNEDRLAFLKNAGVTVEETPVEEENFVMPENFDRVMIGYNELQKAQGLDLSKYKKRKVTRYTYRVKDYPAPDGYEGAVYANLLIYRNKIIACDVSSADPEGFVRPLLFGVSGDV